MGKGRVAIPPKDGVVKIQEDRCPVGMVEAINGRVLGLSRLECSRSIAILTHER